MQLQRMLWCYNMKKRNKKAQGVFGMSFGVIFSIILIVFILVVAGIAIKHFLNLKKCAQVGMFIDDLNGDVGDAWRSTKSTNDFDYILPSALDYVCFANLSNNPKGSYDEKVYSDISIYQHANANMFFYPRENACDMPYVNVEHLDIEKITNSKNPYCFEIKNGKVIINVEMEFRGGLVNLF